MTLDIAAGILVAAAIIGAVWFGLQMVEAEMKRGEAGPGWFVVAIGVAAGAALVLWRLFPSHGA